MIELGDYKDRLSESAYRVLSFAMEESYRRQHFYLGLEHIFLALIKVEYSLFNEIMEDIGINSKSVLEKLEEYLNVPRQYIGVGMKLPSITKGIFKLAWENAQRWGRKDIDSIDLLVVIFHDDEGIPVKIIRSLGVDPDEIVERVVERERERREKEEEIRKRYELPPYLRQFGVNLNKLVRLGKIGEVIGREDEIRRVMEILSHRDRANSVMIVGEPGVGKTAIVEGLAQKIELDPLSVPYRLRGSQIVNLQMNSIVAGTIFRGMFEDRMEKIINEVKNRGNFILFVDEAHSLIGAGSALGVPSDAANILKSSLSRGEVQIIGATTLEEYRGYIQEDEALARRFKLVHVKEPTYSENYEILKGVRKRLEKTYSIKISDEAIDMVMEMGKRYIRGWKMPDKGISWLDSASVKVELRGIGGVVESKDIIEVISDEAEIPIDMVYRDIGERFSNMEAVLRKRVIGQNEAINSLCKWLRLNKGPLKENFDRPDGVLLFLGPTGVGKTELAKALAEFLFGDEKRMIRVDMSEFNDGSLGVEKLLGMPRGIVGSERGGYIVNRIRDNPYTVVLLDEIEKASSYVRNLFLQVFDEGWLTDAKGKRVYFSDSIIIMTSNIGADRYKKLSKPMGFLKDGMDFSIIKEEVINDLENLFSPEFINRIDEVVIFSPLRESEVKEIARNYLLKIAKQMNKEGKKLIFSDKIIDFFAKEGYSIKYGARFLKRKIDELVKVPITLNWNKSRRFIIDVDENGLVLK